MTARPPVETLEASSEGSSGSPETGDTSADEGNGEGAGKLNRTEPSMSRTLEAILSKSDADDDLSVPPEDGGDSVGTRTLLGIGPSGLPLPPRPAKPAAGSGDHEQSFSVEDVFDDEGTAVSSIKANGAGPAAKGGNDGVGDLLDEVAEALNTQAGSHDSTVGALPGRPVPPARPIRTDVRDDDDEFEFEDPDDGPTTLNAGGDDSEDVDVGTDDDDEAVVLGPAKIPPSRPVPAPPGRLPAPAAAASVAGVKTATPFAGLPSATLPSFPAPASGRSRLPTPGPAQAIGGPPPGRAGVPGGTPVNGVPTAAAHADSSRRSHAGRASAAAGGPGADRSAGHNATAAVMDSLTSAMESASVVLKKDVKFRVASLAGVVAATFVVGLLIGRAVIGSGKKTTAEASENAPETTSAKDENKPVAPRAVVAAQPPAPAPTMGAPTAAVPVQVPAAPQAAPSPPVAEATPPPAAFAVPAEPVTPPVHKRRARRALAPKEDLMPKPSATKPAPALKAKAAPAAPAPKKKSTWHDPFAD